MPSFIYRLPRTATISTTVMRCWNFRPGGLLRDTALVLSLCAMITACGGGAADETARSLRPVVAPGNWVVLGSSTAAGVGAPAGQGWVALLADANRPRGVTVLNLARSGLQSSQALPVGTLLPAGRPPPDATVNIDRALATSPRLIVLAFPTNDAIAGVTAADTMAAWQTMQAKAQAAGSATLVLSTQPRAGLTATQQATLDDLDAAAAQHFGTCFVDTRDALVGPDGALAVDVAAGDGIHLNAVGHQRLFERVMATLTSGACVRLHEAT